jgi:hypothetical protein
MVSEPNPPEGEPPVEWMLVTTLPIDTLEQVQTVVKKRKRCTDECQCIFAVGCDDGKAPS